MVKRKSRLPKHELDLNCNTMAELGRRLQKWYGNRIYIGIDGDDILQWRQGKRLDDAPLPPPKRGNYWITREWVEWFDKYLLAKYKASGAPEAANGNGHEQQPREPDGDLVLLNKARDSRLQTHITKSRIEQRRLDLLDARFVETNFVKQMTMGWGQWVSVEHAKVETLHLEFIEKLKELEVPEQFRGQLIEWLLNRLRKFNSDWLSSAKAQLAKMDSDADEQAKQLAQKC